MEVSINEDNITLGTGIMPILLSYLSSLCIFLEPGLLKHSMMFPFDLLHAAFHLSQRNRVMTMHGILGSSDSESSLMLLEYFKVF